VSNLDHFDAGIVGAGVIGLAVASKLARHPRFQNASAVILERHRTFGEETSSRNSEVIHAGIYYPRNSLKARLCVEGRQQLYDWCRRHDIPHRQTGKLIIAGEGQEHELEIIRKRALDNGVADLSLISRPELLALEPEVKASAALYSPSSGIIDSHAYMQSLLFSTENHGAIFSPLTEVKRVTRQDGRYLVETLCQGESYRFTCDMLVNCAGIAAQSVAELVDGFPAAAIPAQQLVKGSYFTLQGKSPFTHLVYPVPEPGLKGLGIHVTLDMAGQTRFGPDTESVETINYQLDPAKETNFRGAIARYFPGIADRTLLPGYSGIRPKLAVDSGVADFLIQAGGPLGFPQLIQLFGIESPGLTASLAIADEVIKQLDC
jgi:L-2-hydroxyglutarate oxidase LhgO